jgi:OmpA-OmpF porin, OOP family
MRRDLKVTIAALSVLGLIGCGGLKYNETKNLHPKGSAFTQELYKNYIALSKGDYDAGNYRNSDRWADATATAAAGQAPKPTQISDWRLPSTVVPEMTTARQRLQTVLDRGGGNVAPIETARAQVGWDCWAERQSTDYSFLPADIAACRQYFHDNIAKAEAALAPGAAPAAAARPDSPKDYLVFFDLNKATLTPEAKKIVADAVAYARSAGAKAVKVVGYTDRSGAPPYNLNLSVRRAEAVEAEMAKLGISPANIAVEGKGEADPLVPTADGVREPQNRRAVLSFPNTSASREPANKEFVQITVVR